MKIQAPPKGKEETGPQAACCGKPYRECKCPPPLDDDTVTGCKSPEHRSAEALEKIGGLLEKIISRLEGPKK